jgi:hypothetical protein
MLDGKTLVIGDGGWGEALALALHRAGRQVALWGFNADYVAEVAASRDNRKYLPGIAIPSDPRRRRSARWHRRGVFGRSNPVHSSDHACLRGAPRWPPGAVGF